MSQIVIPPGDVLLQGNLSFSKSSANPGSVTLPNGSVADAAIASGAAINPAKLAAVELQKEYAQSPGAAGSGTSVAAATQPIHQGNPSMGANTGTILGFTVTPDQTVPGSGISYTVDLQKASSGSTSFSSVLTATITINNSSTAGVAVAASIASTTYTTGDRFRVVVTTTGSGTQGQGLLAILRVSEPYG